MPPSTLLVDHALSTRLEAAEGLSGADFVSARAALAPHVGATSLELGGTYVLFDGATSPVTQTFALGMTAPVTADLLDEIEAFFAARGAPVFHEVSPLADDGVLALLAARGYTPIELTSVMFRELHADVVFSPDAVGSPVTVRRAEPGDHDAWIDTAVAGWAEFTEYAGEIRELSRITFARASARSYLAMLGGRPVATGALGVSGGVALLAGASTIPEARRQGAQLALLNARLRDAALAGCDVAMMCARPGSASQRNAERHGFRIAYTRIKWGRRPA
ncbi:MAG: hypothetical protein IT361_10485 [Gemmatimonadaceae bacterium]|nr:hypothetical protein [Gemmatimonadaceae bacterium]